MDRDMEEIDVDQSIGENVDNDEVVELKDDAKSGKPPKKRKRKLLSSVWENYEMLPIGEDTRQKCKCKKCGAVYIAESKYGTGNLIRHLDNCPRRDTRHIGQLLISRHTSSMSLGAPFSHEKFREILTMAVIKHNLPFQFVEWDGIKSAFLYCREDLNLVTRNTCKNDCLKLHKREKARIKSMLAEAPGRISLTSDCWSSLTTDGYISLTVHFIDKDWNMQKRLLNFCFMPPPHSGGCLSEKIDTFLSDWGIDRKIFAITLDNASANDVCVDMLRTQLTLRDALLCDGEFFHIRCCAHILNLIVQDGLKEIDSAIQKVRESIKYVKGSQGRKQKFFECVSNCNLDSKKGLRQDVPTRWNSTFIMIDNALYFRRAFMLFTATDVNYKSCPSREEWDKLEKISEFLSHFYDLTLVFSRTKYPTANLYFPGVFTIYVTLVEEMKSDDSYKREMAGRMFDKFNKYWKSFSDILAIAVILDPRYKFAFVEWCYKKVYDNGGAYEIMNLKNKLYTLFSCYSKANMSSRSCPQGSSPSENNAAQEVREKLLSIKQKDVLKNFFDNKDSSEQRSQMDQYLDEPRLDINGLDVISYWKSNSYRYPEIAAMARDVLSIPVSTVASESAFSVGGRVLDQYRSSLKPETVEALICTRDWLFGDQEINKDEMVEDMMEKEEEANEFETTKMAACSSSIQVD